MSNKYEMRKGKKELMRDVAQLTAHITLIYLKVKRIIRIFDGHVQGVNVIL